MSTAQAETKPAEAKADFLCSCGRTFAHEISLKRHCWVTGHTAAEGGPAVPSPPAPEPSPAAQPLVAPMEVSLAAVNVVDEALRILREKQHQQAAFEVRRLRQAQLQRVYRSLSHWGRKSLDRATEGTLEGMEVVRQSSILVLRMLLMLLICALLLLFGMGLGRLLAAPAEASGESHSQRISQQTLDKVSAHS